LCGQAEFKLPERGGGDGEGRKEEEWGGGRKFLLA